MCKVTIKDNRGQSRGGIFYNTNLIITYNGDNYYKIGHVVSILVVNSEELKLVSINNIIDLDNGINLFVLSDSITHHWLLFVINYIPRLHSTVHFSSKSVKKLGSHRYVCDDVLINSRIGDPIRDKSWALIGICTSISGHRMYFSTINIRKLVQTDPAIEAVQTYKNVSDIFNLYKSQPLEYQNELKYLFNRSLVLFMNEREIKIMNTLFKIFNVIHFNLGEIKEIYRIIQDNQFFAEFEIALLNRYIVVMGLRDLMRQYIQTLYKPAENGYPAGTLVRRAEARFNAFKYL